VLLYTKWNLLLLLAENVAISETATQNLFHDDNSDDKDDDEDGDDDDDDSSSSDDDSWPKVTQRNCVIVLITCIVMV